jgi:hypothetical protein
MSISLKYFAVTHAVTNNYEISIQYLELLELFFFDSHHVTFLIYFLFYFIIIYYYYYIKMDLGGIGLVGTD